MRFRTAKGQGIHACRAIQVREGTGGLFMRVVRFRSAKGQGIYSCVRTSACDDLLHRANVNALAHEQGGLVARCVTQNVFPQ